MTLTGASPAGSISKVTGCVTPRAGRRVVARPLRGVVELDREAIMDEAGVIREAEAKSLCMLMEAHGWNLSRVARELGVTRMTIYNRLRRWGLTRKRVSKARGPRAGRGATTVAATSTEAPARRVDGARPAARGE